jgi:hypothetical protein
VSAFPGRLGLRIAAAIAGMLAWSWLPAATVDIVRDCTQRVSADKSGIAALSAACPQLEDALQTLGLTPMLYEGWQKRLNSDTLKDLIALTERYGASERGQSPDVAALPGILKSLASEQPAAAKSWWEAVGAWLRKWLAHHPDALAWLDRIALPATMHQVFYYSLIALVLIAAAAVVVNELRAAGAGGRGGRRASAAERKKPARAAGESADMEPLALADKLTALLRTLVNRLMQTRRLSTERSLTHRELMTRSAFDDEWQRAAFAAVADAAESITYGPQAAMPEQLDRVLSDGRDLLARISDMPSAH